MQPVERPEAVYRQPVFLGQVAVFCEGVGGLGRFGALAVFEDIEEEGLLVVFGCLAGNDLVVELAEIGVGMRRIEMGSWVSVRNWA